MFIQGCVTAWIIMYNMNLFDIDFCYLIFFICVKNFSFLHGCLLCSHHSLDSCFHQLEEKAGRIGAHMPLLKGDVNCTVTSVVWMYTLSHRAHKPLHSPLQMSQSVLYSFELARCPPSSPRQRGCSLDDPATKDLFSNCLFITTQRVFLEKNTFSNNFNSSIFMMCLCVLLPIHWTNLHPHGRMSNNVSGCLSGPPLLM